VSTHGCFRCGEQDVQFTEVDYKRTCHSCGESDCIISMQEALDLLNDIYLRDIKLDLNPEEYDIE